MLSACLGLTWIAACSSLDVYTDHDPAANFSNYHTYAWLPESSGRAAPDISGMPSDLMEWRIRAAVDSQLGAKGLRKASSEERPDLMISDRVTQKEKVNATEGGAGFGYGWGPWSGGLSNPSSDIRQYTEGTLVLDFIDAGSKRLVWRGIASDVVEEPGKSAEKINQAVSKTLAKYPPSHA